MNHRFKLAICGTVLMAAALIPTVSHADEMDKKTFLTFSGPVQIPGMTLEAGKYVFKLLESPSDRYIVQVYNDSESHLYTTLLAIPNYHKKTPEKTIVTFYEAPSGQAQPLKDWFYPGDNAGRQFVYPKSEAAVIAKASNENVPSDATYGTVNSKNAVVTASSASTDTSNAQVNQPVTTDSTITTDQTTQAPVDQNAQPVEPETPAPAATPAVTNDTPATPEPPATVDAAPVATEPVAVPDQTPAPAPDTTAPATTDNALPATASSLPLIAFLGLLSIVGAFALRFASRLS